MVLKIVPADICESWMTAHNRLYEFRAGSATLQLFDPLDWRCKEKRQIGTVSLISRFWLSRAFPLCIKNQD